MKCFGLNKELVQSAIIHKIFSNDKVFNTIPSVGTFLIKNNKVYYEITLRGYKKEQIEVGVYYEDVDLNILNDERTSVYIVQINDIKGSYFELLVSSGKTKEESIAEVEKQLVEMYVNKMNIKSKHSLIDMVKEYEKAFN